MTQIELLRIAKRIEKMPIYPWHLRETKKLRELTKQGDYDALYSFVINDWILNQPDKECLMELFILCGFVLGPFFKIIVSPPPDPKRKAA